MRVALAASLALLVLVLVLVLSSSALTVAGTNSIPASAPIGYAKGGTRGCQSAGTVPQGTSALRISASINVGPRVKLQVLSGSQVITAGTRDAGWGIDESVTIPVKRVARTIPNARICIGFGAALEPIELKGSAVEVTTAQGKVGRAVRLRIEYMRPGRTWWSLASSVARRMGLGHAPAGTWMVLVLIALMLAVAALTSRLLLRELR